MSGPVEEHASVVTARTIEEVERLRTYWETMQRHPNADIDFYLTIVKARKEVERPHVMVLIEKGVIKAMLIGRIENTKLPLRFGYKTLLSPSVRSLTMVYGGSLGDISSEHARVIFMELRKSLRNGEAEVIFFNNLRTDSDIYKLAMQARGLWHRSDLSESNLHWKTSPFTTYDDFYKSRSQNTRGNLRRYSKKVQQEFGSELTIGFFSQPSDLETIMTDIEEVSQKTYHRGLGAGFIKDPVMYQRVLLGLEKHRFRSWVLYIKGIPCAFWTGVRYDNIFFIDSTGYDSQYERFHPGTFLFVRMMQDLFLEGVQVVDFGLGDAQYKRDYCEEHWNESEVYLFAPTLRGVSLDLAKSICGCGERVSRSLLERMSILMKVKKLWRNRLAKKPLR